jgi:antitoxin CptB
MDRVARERLKWNCRRGMLELDLVLGRFLERDLREGDLAPLGELLRMPDNDLWDIVSGRSESFEPRHRDVVARLRAA